MLYIKVPATDSTNSELKRRLRENRNMQNTCLSTENQTQGRGQRGAGWTTEIGKNLTFSVLLNNINLPAEESFKLNALISLFLVEELCQILPEKDFWIKWPNDILAGQQKICGILIENMLKGNQIKQCIIGIGLNVNQTHFENLPKATSLKEISDENYDLDMLTHQLAEGMEKFITYGLNRSVEELWSAYEVFLFRKDIVSEFDLPDGSRIEGIIRGVSPSGLLVVEIQGNPKHFDLKELRLIY